MRRKVYNWCQEAQENMKPMPSTGKHETYAKERKIGVKSLTGAMCRKVYNWRQARENMKPEPSAGKPTTQLPFTIVYFYSISKSLYFSLINQ